MRKIRTVRDLRGEVYRILRQEIIDGTLEPGTRLLENDLVQRLNVSRTPIREALNQLSKEGLVEIIPRKGTYVRRWTLEEALEILLLREVLEGLAARLATEHLNPQDLEQLESYLESYRRGEIRYTESDRRFHEHIVTACGMKRLQEIIRNLHDSMQMIKALKASFESPRRIEQSLAEHRRIIEALRSGDPDQVEQAMRDNFRRTRRFIKEFRQD